ncbi:MAG: hypothetical protein HQK52_20885 [Oligoflexia bacterium]|nr:hypothetical protein [Oligoflexia bacterium]
MNKMLKLCIRNRKGLSLLEVMIAHKANADNVRFVLTTALRDAKACTATLTSAGLTQAGGALTSILSSNVTYMDSP